MQWILVLVGWMLGLPAWTQGTVVFSNGGGGFRAPTFGALPENPSLARSGNPTYGLPAGSTDYGAARLLEGGGFIAELWVGNNAGDLSPVLDSQTSFRTTTNAGFMVPKTLTIPGFPSGTTLQYQVRVWDSRGGAVASWPQVLADPCVLRGMSEVLSSEALGGGGAPPAQLSQLRSFNLHSECLPLIAAPPVSTAASRSGTAVFQVGALNPAGMAGATLTYQWQTNGIDLVGATNPVLTLTNVQQGQEAAYRAVVRNPAGAVTTRVARLDVNGLPSAAVPKLSAWRYLDTGTDPGADWTQIGFDDSAWKAGHGILGFGETNQTTALLPGRVAYYLRRLFHVADPATVGSVTASVLRDDGAVVYVNGVEVFRSNMPAGAVDRLTRAASEVSGPDESTYFTQLISPILRRGSNVVAVELHQELSSSSDLAFDLELRVNTFPSITPIADQTTVEDQPTAALSFSIADAETPATNLVLSATSSDPELVPVGNIVFLGVGATRQVVVTPTSDRAGTSLLTILVGDGEGAGNAVSFRLTVLPVNDAPTLDKISNLDVIEGAGLQSVNLTGISAGPQESQTIAVTATSSAPGVIPTPTVKYISPNSTGLLSLTPIPGVTGQAVITVAVRDAGFDGTLNTFDDSTTLRSFVVNVIPTEAPRIENLPASIEVSFGKRLELAPTISGQLPMTYQWKFNGTLIPGATNPVYVIPSFQCENDGRYDVEACAGSAVRRCSSGTAIVTSAELYDFGDAPAHYPVRRTADGARHRFAANGFRLGEYLDGEPDGRPTVDAQGDDADPGSGVDDEDGVVLPAMVEAGSDAVIVIRVRKVGEAGDTAFLNAWIDFDGDGIWAPSAEAIARGLAIKAGDTSLPIHIPETATNGLTFVRVRLSASAEILNPTGCADDGEVEDHALEITRAQAIVERCEGSHRGTAFWVAFPGNYDFDPADPLQLALRVLGSSGTAVRVEVPGESRARSLRIGDEGRLIIDLPRELQLQNPSIVERKGVYVESDREVSVVAQSFNPYSSDSFLALPIAIGGIQFAALSYPNTQLDAPELAGSQMAIVAAYNNTRVSISPTVRVAGQPAGGSFELVLHRGQTYLLRGRDPAFEDVSGTTVIATKPINVFSGHRCANITQRDNFFCNYLVEQLLPVPYAGTNFCLAPTRLRRSGDLFRVLALRDATEVTLGTIPPFVLARGEIWETNLTHDVVLRTSRPVFVNQYGNSADVDRATPGGAPSSDSGDPTMVVVPSIDLYLAGPQVVEVPSGRFDQHRLTLIVPSTALGSVTSNGVAISERLFSRVGDGPYSAAQIPVAPGAYVLNASAPFLATVRGQGEFEAYSHLGGLFFPDRTPPRFACPPTTRISDANLSGCQVGLPALPLPRATDNCPGSDEFIEYRQSPAPGTLIGPGTHAVTITATDVAGNTSSCVTFVIVEDGRLACREITPSFSNGSLNLIWSGQEGVLERSPAIEGPWIPVSGASNRFSASIDGRTPSEYFRVRYPGK